MKGKTFAGVKSAKFASNNAMNFCRVRDLTTGGEGGAESFVKGELIYL